MLTNSERGGDALTPSPVYLPREDASLAADLRNLGIDVLSVPLQTLEILPATNPMQDADWVVITSPRTMGVLQSLGWQIPKRARIAAVSPSVAKQVQEAGYHVDRVPPHLAGMEALMEIWPEGSGRVVVPGSSLMWPGLVMGLEDKGWQPLPVSIYTLQMLEEAPEGVASAWQRGEFSGVVVASGSVALAISRLLGFRDDIPVVAVGVSAQDVLASAGVQVSASTRSEDSTSVAEAIRSVTTW